MGTTTTVDRYTFSSKQEAFKLMGAIAKYIPDTFFDGNTITLNIETVWDDFNCTIRILPAIRRLDININFKEKEE